MEIKKVPDIKIRAKNEQGNLEWKSLRGQKMMAQGLWRTILPGTYRLSHEGYWYELSPLELEMYLAWSPYPETGVPTGLQVINKVPKLGTVPEDIHVTLTKVDEQLPTLEDKLVVAGSSYTNNTYIHNYTKNPVEVVYTLNTGGNLNNSGLAKYIINTNRVTLPYMLIPNYIMNFPNTEYSISTLITLYAGDIQYSEGNPSINPTFELVSKPDWIKSVTPTTGSNGTSVTVTCEAVTGIVHNRGTVEFKCVQYPFLKATIDCIQDVDVASGKEMIDPDYLLIRETWPINADFDNLFYCYENRLGIPKVGYYSGTFKSGSTDGALWFSGDITANNQPDYLYSGDRSESFLINFSKLKELNIPEVTTFYLYGSWFSESNLTTGDLTSKGSSISIYGDFYKGNVSFEVYDSPTDVRPNTGETKKEATIRIMENSIKKVPGNTLNTYLDKYIRPATFSSTIQFTDTIHCYSKAYKELPYVNKVNTSDEQMGTYTNCYCRPLLKVEYYRSTGRAVITSLK